MLETNYMSKKKRYKKMKKKKKKKSRRIGAKKKDAAVPKYCLRKSFLNTFTCP